MQYSNKKGQEERIGEEGRNDLAFHDVYLSKSAKTLTEGG